MKKLKNISQQKSPKEEKEPRAKCCGRLVDHNNRCTRCGDKY